MGMVSSQNYNLLELMAQSVINITWCIIFYTVEPLHNVYPGDKVRGRVMTSQVSVRFFKYEKNYFFREKFKKRLTPAY